MSVLVARYRRWLRLPAYVVPGRILIALLAGVTALVFVAGGVVGGLIANDYPRGGRLVGLVLAACGAFGLVMAYRTLRGKASVRELVALTTLWASTGWVDAWINDTPKPLWSWSSLPLVVVALLLWDGWKDAPAHDDGRSSGASAAPDRVTH